MYYLLIINPRLTPGGLFAKKNCKVGAYLGLTFSLRVEQKYMIHFPQYYIYQSTSISSQSSISIISSAGAAELMSPASGVTGFSSSSVINLLCEARLPFLETMVLIVFAYHPEGGHICKNDFLGGGLFEGGAYSKVVA